MISQSIIQARSIITEMSPPILSELGFCPALEWLSEQIGKQHEISIVFERKKGLVELTHEAQVLLFQATRELLMNVVKHSKAKDASVTLSGIGQNVRIEVKDSGMGFDIKKSFQPDLTSGYGLFSIRERLRYVDGDLYMKSKPGHGTSVVLKISKSSNR